MYLWGKAAIRSAARVLFNPPESLNIADELCEALDDKPKLDLNAELDGSNPAFEAIANSSRRHRQVLDLALELQGRLSGESIHASAFILSPFPILDQMPLVVTKDERKLAQETGEPIREYCISYDGTITQDNLGFVKLDLLCLKDLEMMELVCNTVERIYGCKLDLEKLPLDDKAVFDLVLAGNNSGIFQFDGSPVALRILQDSGADRIADWSAVNALNRPGPLQMGYDREFIDGKKDPSSVTYFAPAAETQLKETYGTICIAQGQMVETSRGKIPIEEVIVGDKVIDEQGQWHNVSRFFDNGYKDTVKVRASFGKELICTPDHKIMTQDGWKEAQELTPKDFIKCVNPYKARGELKEKEEFDWTEWLVGLFAVNGSSVESTPSIACRDERFARNLAETVKEHMFPDIELAVELHDAPHGESTWNVVFYQEPKPDDSSKNHQPNQIDELLKRYGFYDEAGSNRYFPRECTYSMLTGMFEGDGCYADNRLHTKCERLAEECYEALLSYGINASICKDADSWTVAVDGDIREIMPSRVSGMESCSAGREDKEDAYVPRICRKDIHDEETSHLEWGKVISVEPHRVEHVFDITVDDVHKFVCQNMVVSNCYQEQIMMLSQDPTIVGFDGTQADTLRKATAKKKADKVEAICNEAREVAKKNHTDPKVTEYFLEAAKASGSYSFNKSHSLAYAVVAYRGAFLKAHFPECFLAAMCTLKPLMKKVNKVPAYLEEARQMGVQVKPPHVNYSMEDFDVPEKGVIAFGLGGIKRVGKGAGPVIAEREKNGPYKDFTDFCCRVPKEVGKAPIEALIKAGACDGLGWSRMAMEESIEQIIQFRKDYFKEKSKRDMFEDDLFGFGEPSPSNSTTPEITLVPPFDTEYSEMVLMRKERDEFGMYFDKDPRDFSKVSRFILEKELRGQEASKAARGTDDYVRFVNVKDVPEMPDKTHVGFIANVDDFREFNTKKGKRMASMFVWDNGVAEESRFGFAPTKNKVKCTIFSSVLATIAKPMPDDVVYITGRVSVDKEGNWPTAVLVDTIDLVAPDSQWLGSGASVEKMTEFAEAQSEMNALNAELGDPSSKRYLIPAISFPTTDNLVDFCEDMRINKLYLKEGNVQVSAEDDPDGANTKILHLKQTMGTVKLAAEYGGMARKIRHPKAARALARKAMLEGRTVDEIESEQQAQAQQRAASSAAK